MTNIKSRQLMNELNKNLGNKSRNQDYKDADDNFKKVMMQFKLKEAHHTSENSWSTRPSSDKSKDKQTEEDVADLAELKQGHHVDLKQEARMHFKNLAEEMKNQGGKEVLKRPNNGD
ncbi:uncharacterized protein LOC132733896 [Ruditapes philippinarum]|uniref:uncharacterized protein LOC132733896 n=1 Tax=Ruditapes philippinarum TaxID=129788 RepID=UPI00295BBC74|nr:uncharacterized protein LOC132733896 [Ruditapes philippinarum]